MTDSSETRSIFIAALRDAHAMENQALSIMEPQISRIEKYPQVAQRLQQHIHETEGQMARLEKLLDDLGDDTSTLKDMVLSSAGSMTAIGYSMVGDEILKTAFANFAFENYEIAAYNSLLVIAALGSFPDALPALQANLDEEIAMADWLNANIRAVTIEFASLRVEARSAKV